MNIVEQNENIIISDPNIELTSKDLKREEKRKKKEENRKRKHKRKMLRNKMKNHGKDTSITAEEKKKKNSELEQREKQMKNNTIKDDKNTIENITKEIPYNNYKENVEKDESYYTMEANNKRKEWLKLEEQLKNNQSSSPHIHQTQSLSIYQHVPWYTFQPTINSKDSSDDAFDSTRLLSKSKSESNLPQKSKESTSKKETIPPLETSFQQPPPLPPRPCPSDTNLNSHTHSLQSKSKFEPENFKNEIFATLKDRENEYCFDYEKEYSNKNFYDDNRNLQDDIYVDNYPFPSLHLINDYIYNSKHNREYENFKNYEKYLKSQYFYSDQDHRDYLFYNKHENESRDNNYWHPTKKIGSTHSNPHKKKNIFLDLVYSSSSSSPLLSHSTSSSYSYFDKSDSYNRLIPLHMEPEDFNEKKSYDKYHKYNSWPLFPSYFPQENMYNDDNFEEEYSKSLSSSLSTDNKNKSSTSTLSRNNKNNMDDNSENKNKMHSYHHSYQNHNSNYKFVKDMRDSKHSHLSSTFTPQSEDSYDMCICSKNGSCSCPPDCYCKNIFLLNYPSKEEIHKD